MNAKERKAQALRTYPAPAATWSLSSTEERRAYVEAILAQDSVVHAPSLALALQVSGAVAANFLLGTMQLESFGSGRYRRGPWKLPSAEPRPISIEGIVISAQDRWVNGPLPPLWQARGPGATKYLTYNSKQQPWVTSYEIVSYCDQLGIDARELMNRVKDLFWNVSEEEDRDPRVVALMETIDSLGVTKIATLLEKRWTDKQITREHTKLMILREALAEMLTLHDLQKEVERAADLGWSTETLTPEVRQRGWKGPALEHFNSSDPEEIKALTNVLKSITGPYTPPLESLPKPPDPDVQPVLTSTAERKAYVESMLDRDGMVSCDSLSPVFKMYSAAVSKFLEGTMQLEHCGKGRYRRAR